MGPGRSLIVAALALLWTGCLKDEIPVPAPPPGTATQGQACIGVDYSGQVWYDISSNTVVRSNSKMDWDLAFEGGADGWHVRLNGARFMRAVEKADGDISQPVDTNGFAPLWRVDHNSGSLDSTAIRDWRDGLPVYAIDLGYNTLGLRMGVRQLRILSVDATGYTFQVAGMNGTGLQEYTVAKDPQRSWTHFRISSGQAVTISPPQGAYDLVFTQYTHQFYDPHIAYLVTGAVNGYSGCRVARVTGDFAAVTLADTLMHPFSSAEDGVGYEWKEYDFDTDLYVLYPDRIFIVQDAEGAYHKLHFTGFYNENGERGCPKFEVQPL